MSVRLTRAAFRSAALRNLQTSSALRVSRRMTSTSSDSHGSTHSSSDKPWIIGSLLIFGPALLYLISPSARKSHHAGHHDTEHKVKHDLPVPMRDEHSTVDKDPHATPLATTEEPDLMKDDEGTVANVASSVALSEASDVPQDAQSDEKLAELKSEAEAENEPSKPVENTSSSGSADGNEGADKEPTHMGEVHQAAKDPARGTQHADDSKKD